MHREPDADDDAIRIPIEDSIDLHAFHPRDIKSVVDEYITAAHQAGLREVRVIHGRGTHSESEPSLMKREV